MVLVCETRVVIVCIIPKALRSHTNALARHLANYTLYNNLVLWDVAIVLDLSSDRVNNLLGPVFCVSVLIFFLSQHSFNHRLDDDFDFGWVESEIRN